MRLRWLLLAIVAVAVLAGGGSAYALLGNGGDDAPPAAPSESPAANRSDPADDSAPQPGATWPDPELRQQIIDLALAHPPVAELLAGHRFEVDGVGYYLEKGTSCSDPEADLCGEVGIYDYTVPTGLVVVIDVKTMRVVRHQVVPEFQGGTTPEREREAINIVLSDPRLSQSTVEVKIKPAATASGVGRCGSPAPLHVCLIATVGYSTGDSCLVVLDLVDRTVAAAFSTTSALQTCPYAQP